MSTQIIGFWLHHLVLGASFYISRFCLIVLTYLGDHFTVVTRQKRAIVLLRGYVFELITSTFYICFLCLLVKCDLLLQPLHTICLFVKD